MRNTLKVLLVVAYVAWGYEPYRSRLLTLLGSNGAAALAYVALFTLLAFSLLCAAFIRTGILRWAVAIVFAAAAAFWDTNGRISSQFMTYDNFVSQLDASSFLNEAVHQYRDSIVSSVMFVVPLLLGIGLRPAAGPSVVDGLARRLRVPGRVMGAAPLLALVLLTLIMFARGGEGGRGLPSPFTPLAYVNLLAYEALTQSVGPREPVRLPHTGRSPAYDIALIIDESVSGQYLGINSPFGVPTPLSRPPADVQAYNYGYAAAVTNCSSGVNVTLRFGGTREDYPRMNRRMPSLWQYAKAAGLETVYIDAQRTHGVLVNRMTPREMEDVDKWIQFDDVPVRDRDMAMAARLTELFADGRPQFIFAIKIGAHFPVHDKAPDEFMRYLPALPRGQYDEVSDTGSRDGFAGTAADWALYRNSYRNTLLWTVGEFFNRLFASGALKNAVMIYTSDHGQDLHERGTPGLNTHCGATPVMEEGLVPLVVLQGASVQSLDWDTHFAENRNRSSHFNIAPTILEMMGFEPSKVRAIYGKPLSVPTEDPFTFNSRFNARLGTPPKWEYIDLERIARPPATELADASDP